MEKARTDNSHRPVVDAEWQPAGVPMDLRHQPRNIRAERQRRARRRAVRETWKRRAFGWLAALFFFLAYGCVGYMEQGGDLVAGMAACFTFIALFALFATLNGAMVW